MKLFTRQGLLVGAVSLLLASASFAVEPVAVNAVKENAKGDATKVQVVYHVADGIEQAQRALGNAYNHLNAEPNTKIVVVALSHGVDFLIEGAKDTYGNPFAARVASLSARGVEFRVCNNTLKGAKIDPATLMLEAKIVTSGVAEIARLQAREGFVYLRP